jgi:hypothetical protein
MKGLGRNTKEDGKKKGGLKVHMLTDVQDVLFEKVIGKGEYGVFKVEHIHLQYKKNKKVYPLCLRLVYYKDEKGRKHKYGVL